MLTNRERSLCGTGNCDSPGTGSDKGRGRFPRDGKFSGKLIGRLGRPKPRGNCSCCPVMFASGETALGLWDEPDELSFLEI